MAVLYGNQAKPSILPDRALWLVGIREWFALIKSHTRGRSCADEAFLDPVKASRTQAALTRESDVMLDSIPIRPSLSVCANISRFRSSGQNSLLLRPASRLDAEDHSRGSRSARQDYETKIEASVAVLADFRDMSEMTRRSTFGQN
ncbi:hypothetical protein DOTSEDRAFT_70681 [Dothistroma septosporum NZE10]|uniref:Uncharacterized protein n=1 Tax=Dothistroma septosporum (strain NZE10 / CBS 128990) TaxID=675120 RepID=N1PWL3_DOTSN|nr:hypothetical protein DOTSEDRAFT_70681 [Dothistroma septosporum NZE10]